MSGSDGCNPLTGTYQLIGDSLTSWLSVPRFGESTRACRRAMVLNLKLLVDPAQFGRKRRSVGRLHVRHVRVLAQRGA